MGCLIALIAMLSPRLALVLIWIFSERVDIAFDGWFVPFVGLLILPWTTLMYTVAYAPIAGVNGLGWFCVALAFLVDICSYGGGEMGRRQRTAMA